MNVNIKTFLGTQKNLLSDNFYCLFAALCLFKIFFKHYK